MAMSAQAEQAVLVQPASTPPEALDPIHLVLNSSGVVLAVLGVLLVASTAVWFIWILKVIQMGRLRSALGQFEHLSERCEGAEELVRLALSHRSSPGARIVIELAKRHEQAHVNSQVLLAVARRALASEQQRASSLMPTLSSIASASPFIGLFGTVWGIMNAFLRIGVEKSASLPVVAPAIGEALIATAVGLVAAIPATIAYNYIDRRIADFLDELSASSETWSELIAAEVAPPAAPSMERRPQAHPGLGQAHPSFPRGG